MPTLPNMSLITPTLGADSGTWDDKINAAFALVDAHDHTAGKGVTVPVSGMNFNADINLTTFGATLSKISFNTIAAPSTGSKNLFVNTADNELYWRSNAGTNVKLTSGASINTSLVGGIVGDYSTVSALFAYEDADQRYTAKTPTSTWARMASGPVRIYEYNTSESVYVELAAPAALGASYTVTWPTAVPAAQSLMQMSTTGVVSLGGTGIDHEMTLVAGRSFNVSGAGKYKHDGRTINAPAIPYIVNTTGGTAGATAGVAGVVMSVSTTTHIPLLVHLPTESNITTIVIHFTGAVGAGLTLSLYNQTAGTFGIIGGTGAGTGATSVTLSGMLIGAANGPFWIRAVTDGATTCTITHFAVTYTV